MKDARTTAAYNFFVVLTVVMFWFMVLVGAITWITTPEVLPCVNIIESLPECMADCFPAPDIG